MLHSYVTQGLYLSSWSANPPPPPPLPAAVKSEKGWDLNQDLMILGFASIKLDTILICSC